MENNFWSKVEKIKINLQYSDFYENLSEEQKELFSNELNQLNESIEEEGLSIHRPFDPKLFAVVQKKFNLNNIIYYYSCLFDYHHQFEFLAKKEIDLLLISINELQDQLQVADQSIKDKGEQIQSIKNNQIKESEIEGLNQRVRNLQLANTKLQSYPTKFTQLNQQFEFYKKRVNKEEYERTEFGKNLLKIIKKLSDKLEIDLEDSHPFDEASIFEKVQDDLVNIFQQI